MRIELSEEIPVWVVCTAGTVAAVVLYAFVGGLAYGMARRAGSNDADKVGIIWPLVGAFLAVEYLLVTPLILWPARLASRLAFGREEREPKEDKPS